MVSHAEPYTSFRPSFNQDINSQECACLYIGLHVIQLKLQLQAHGSNVSTKRLETLF